MQLEVFLEVIIIEMSGGLVAHETFMLRVEVLVIRLQCIYSLLF